MTIPGPRGSSRRGAGTSACVIQPRAGVLPFPHSCLFLSGPGQAKGQPYRAGRGSVIPVAPGHPDKLDSDWGVGGTKARSRHILAPSDPRQGLLSTSSAVQWGRAKSGQTEGEALWSLLFSALLLWQETLH